MWVEFVVGSQSFEYKVTQFFSVFSGCLNLLETHGTIPRCIVLLIKTFVNDLCNWIANQAAITVFH